MSFESDTDRLAMIQGCGGELVSLFDAPFTTTIWAIIDSEYVEVNGVESLHPVALVRTSDITSSDANYTVVHGSALVRSDPPHEVDAEDLSVIGIQPSGTGLTTLILHKQ